MAPSAAKSYVKRFTAMVKELEAHPRVVLLTFHVFPKAKEAELREAEEKLGQPLPPALRRFYAREANGLQLRWRLRDSIDFEPRKDRYRPGPFKPLQPLSESQWANGCVSLLPAWDFARQVTRGRLCRQARRRGVSGNAIETGWGARSPPRVGSPRAARPGTHTCS